MRPFSLSAAAVALLLSLTALGPGQAQEAAATAAQTDAQTVAPTDAQTVAPTAAPTDALATPTAEPAPPSEPAPAPAPVEDDTTAAMAPVDYLAWDRVAQRAEQAIEAGRASDQALQTLRTELVAWRERFAATKAENQVRISTLKTQISTLGPAPADGGTEPAILTERRNELTAQLEEAEAPNKAAELARARATALIGEIDTTLRTRQTDELLAAGPTPLNPANWPKALEDVALTARLAWSGVTSSWGTLTQRAEMRANLPLTLVYAVLALVLLVRGRSWVIRAGAKLRARSEGPAQGVIGFLVSLGQVLAPLAGVYALVEALHVSGILGLRAQVIVDTLPTLGMSFFVARWLGNRVFGQPGAPWQVLDLPQSRRAEGRWEAATLGLLYGLAAVLATIAAYESYSTTTQAVLGFPVTAFAGFVLFRLGQLLRSAGPMDPGDAQSEESASFLTRISRLTGLILIVMGVLGPLGAALGYSALAGSFIFPATLTLALVAAILVLHHFFLDLYGLVFKVDDARAGEALIPVLASFIVILGAGPILALIWGARVTDLTELWTRFREGVTVGGTVISPGDLVTFGVVFSIGYGATRLLQGMLKTTILPKTKMDLGGRNAITSGVGYVGLFLAALIAITSAGFDLSSLAIVAGALSVGIGFGLQNVVSNFVSGIILLIERPISEGDWIEVGGQMGHVRDISVRSTRIETFDRTDVVIPNSDLISGVVTNFTRGNLIGRVIVPVGVAYGSDTRRVEEILLEIAKDHPLVTVNPAPSVVFQAFGADSLNFEIRAILKDVNFKLQTLSEINHQIAERFVAEGIEIPFAQRDIWLRNPEALIGVGGGAGASAAPPPAAKKPKPKKKAAAKPAAKSKVTPPQAARQQLDEGDMPSSMGYGPQDEDD